MTREQILSSEFTKTKKAFMLYDLGYTRSDVSIWITNGNYGFAHNIWKKWNDRRTETIEPEVITPFEFNFNRTCGIELVINEASRDTLIREFARVGLTLVSEGYNHNTRNHWKLVTDGSVTGNNPNEVVSPVLQGMDGLEQVKKAVIALNRAGAKVNNSCGFHVHFGASDLNLDTFKNLIKSHIEMETTFDSIVPVSRRCNNNTYCKSLTSVATSKATLLTKVNAANSINEIIRLFSSRYVKMNFQSYLRQGTIEFRQHSGTTSFAKIRNWVLLNARLIEYCKSIGFTSNIKKITNESLQDYIEDRAVDLAA